MNALRRLSYAALALAFLQIVFGAIVRITGSGWGCGHHWPKCDGQWIPPLERTDLVIEVMHRYLALALTIAVIALVVAAWRRRDEAGVGGRRGVLPMALAALAIVVSTALLGAATIKTELAPLVVVAHLALAMTLLATLAVAALRAGGFGADGVRESPTAAKTWRVARVAAILAFVVLVLGALTANLGAAGACLGFPHCRAYTSPNAGLVHLQLTHRVLAFLFAGHMLGAVLAMRKRGESAVVKRAALAAFAIVIVQILVAAALVEMRLPPVLRSLHQAVGALVWVAVVIFAALAKRAVDGQFAVLRGASPLESPLPDAGRVARAPGTTPTGASTAITLTPRNEPDVVARMAETERAARAYEAAMIALVVTAETQIEQEPDGDDADDGPGGGTVDGIPLTSEPTPVAPSTAAPPAAASPPAGPPSAAPPPVALPPDAETPGATDALAAPKRPHSVAVIVARGADL